MGYRRNAWPRPLISRLAAAAVGVALSTTVLAAPAQAQPGGNTDFYSSFEPGDPQPAWTDTAETLPDGTPKASGVNGDDPTRIPGDITDKVTEVTANGENSGSGEVKENLVDHDPNTKWLVFESTGWVQFKFSEPVNVVRYALTSANDFPGRDPRDWTLRGSNDGQSWTDLDKQTGQSWDQRFQTKEYKFTGGADYLYYRLDFTANNGDPIVQLAEVQFSETTPQAEARIAIAPNMTTQIGNGPTSAYTSKTKVGFTGLKAFRYVGTHLAQGRAYSYNKVFDVNVVVTPTTQLSYKIFPEFLLDDLNYPGTYASVDLAFTDGTYLSDLKAVDQRGFPLTPQGQGASKALYTNQWNNIASSIGAVAAGKTIDRILLAYDNPNGPTGFKGWVDDIRVVGSPQAPARSHLSDYVLTTRGTNATSSFSRGNNYPATAVPHGFNFWTPMTNADSTDWLYHYSKVNNADNLPTLQAFTASHEPSPWMGDRQTFQVMPSTADGVPNANRGARALPFKHDNEVAKAHYYSVQFENGVKTELTPTDHAAVFRFGFPGQANLIFDNVNNNGGLTLDAAGRTITGYSDVRSGLSAGAGRLFVYATFDQPVTASGKLPGGGGSNVTGYFKFGDVRQVTMKIATSLISVEQARRNLEMEVSASDTLETVRDRAQKAWDDQLKVIEVEGASDDQRTTLYSNLYRLLLYPNSGFENTGTAQAPKYQYASAWSPNTGQNTPTQTGAKIVDGKVYVNNGFWDTYRTTWPAYALLTPSKAGEMVDGFVQQYRDGGWIARWSSPGYANLMTGTSSDVAFADAYVKGISNFDAVAAYDAAIRNATVTPPNVTNSSVGRKGIDKSIFLGYTPTSVGEGMSWAMEGYVNDFGIAQLAQALYDKAAPNDPRRQEYKENAEYFRNRAQNYVNMFDKSVGFFQGRNDDGSWRWTKDQYDPRVWGYDYTETDGWNMAFTVPQDGQGLANLYGGRDKLAQKLDQFFATPETARFPGSYGGIIHEMIEARDVRMGQYGHSNQPSHHIPYMYDFTGQPSKTQAKVREILSRLYLGSEIGQGYAGDEDNGEMSAWYIFSALGFYPVQMGSPNYAIGSPLFTKATINLENGKKLVINAPKNNAQNVYVQGLKVNGKAYDKTFLPHDLLAAGGTLDFDMGPKPSNWGTGADAVFPSLTKGNAVPQPLRDVSGNGTNSGPAEVFDNSSQTEATLDTVAYTAARPHDVVTYYTVTSGKTTGRDPANWVLKGSFDGKNWAVVDERKGQSFAWRQQTKAFQVAKPSRYTQYRLEFEGQATVAEVEFLAKPTPACTQTITGKHDGPLTVTGVVCLQDATQNGPVQINAGGSLYAFGGTINGPVNAYQPGAVALIGTQVTGPVSINRATGEVSVGAAAINGPVSLVDSAGPVVGSTSVTGPVSCSGNNPPPANNGLVNTVQGPRSGQCGTL
ncbi:GH92 family glycosyl hydrolase [Actinocrispum sp. NPDC049592]|uniref:GH92 family glycosyl hydrolase n=1 Tax=Actinocrispum sp. NPDC049592 TaxID=3154835 RepID=UPI0034383D19